WRRMGSRMFRSSGWGGGSTQRGRCRGLRCFRGCWRCRTRGRSIFRCPGWRRVWGGGRTGGRESARWGGGGGGGVGEGGRGGGLTGVVEYATDLFERGTVEALAGRLIRLLEGAVAEPERRIGELDILAAWERERLLCGWNATRHEVPSVTVDELFAAQAARTP